MQACKLNLPHTRPSLDVTSLLLEPSSNTLALMHADSSILLLPSLSPFSPSLSPQSQTLIPPTSTSSCFIRLQPAPNSPNPRVVFAVAGPYHGDSRLLLRFWILKNNRYVRAKVVSNQKGFVCDDKLGVFAGFDHDHGVGVRLVGEVNFFAMHLASKSEIWVFAVKMVEGDEDCVKLIKCGVIDCSFEICSICVSSGFLFLGESSGVRVFPLRLFGKGNLKEQMRKNCKKKILQRNCEGCSESTGHSKCGDKSGKAETNAVSSKLRSVKLKQDSSVGGGTFFVQFSLEEPCQKSSTKSLSSLRAVSVQSLSQKKFLVLDSDGDLHLLGLYSGLESTGHMKRLSHTMKVQLLAVLPDLSTKAQTFWISDGISSVHIMSVSDMEIPSNENDKRETVEKQMQISAIEAVFASEKVQDLIPLSTDSMLLLGQGNIFAYAIS